MMSEAAAYYIIGIAVGSFASYYWIKWRTNQVLQFEKYANAFYQKIGPIIKDDETPTIIIDVLSALNDIVTDKTVARNIILSLLLRVKRDFNIEAQKDEPSEIDDFLRQRPELGRACAAALVSAAVAVTYRGPIAGWFLRTFVFVNLNRLVNQPSAVASELRSFGLLVPNTLPAQCDHPAH